MKNHFALYISNKEDKGQIIEQIQDGILFEEICSLKGALFSEIAINKFVEEERIHGRLELFTEHKNSLQYASQGERKKALLKHIISQNPGYIILDNVFGNLDVKSQNDIKNSLTRLSSDVLFIQIATRKQDILPFIKTIYEYKEQEFVLCKALKDLSVFSNDSLRSLPLPYKSESVSSDPIIKFNNVSVSYSGRGIIKDISWEIKAGEFWQLLGPNGSGKSTILSMIYGENPKAYGQDITLFGVKKGSGESVWEIKSKIGYFSSDMLRGFKRLDSIGNMIVSGFFDTIGLYDIPNHQQINIAHQWLHVLDMFEIRKKDFLSLSRGHQSLVLIARAMVKQPPLLILDEPTNGLDDHDAFLFAQLINRIAKETETAILYVSHRKEAGLKPDFVFELLPSELGSFGKLGEGF